MAAPLKGLVKGKTVVLDESVPPLEGKRVLVVLELEEEPEADLDPQQNLEAWKDWAASDPQGPIEDDGEPTFRDRAGRHPLVSFRLARQAACSSRSGSAS